MFVCRRFYHNTGKFKSMCRRNFSDHFNIKKGEHLPAGTAYTVQDIACGYEFTIVATRNQERWQILTMPHNDMAVKDAYLKNVSNAATDLIPIESTIDEPLKVACGRSHFLVASEKAVWACGNNSYGQCGHDANVKNFSYAKSCQKVGRFENMAIADIVCGQDSSYVISNGIVYSCGWSADGQTGRGSVENQSCFAEVEGDLKNEYVAKIAGSCDTMLALTDKGEVFGWGNSEYNQFSMLTSDIQVNVPIRLPLKNESRIVDIGSSGTSCFVVTEAGEVWSWGYGILGKGPTNLVSKEPKIIPSIFFGGGCLNSCVKIDKIFCGPNTVGAVTNKGDLYAWGVNLMAILNRKIRKPVHFPLQIPVPGKVNKVSFGFNHGMVMTE